MPYYVYIIAGERNGTLYIGATNDLTGRQRRAAIFCFARTNIFVYFVIARFNRAIQGKMP
jgi:hypothetical protein